MSIVTKEILKTYFDDGSRPTGNNFADLIDSLGHVDTGFANGGNAFGANAILGSTDAYSLQFKTNNQIRASIDGSGIISFNTSFAANSGTTAFSVLNIITSYNQTGTANGTIRGIYYNPTVTSALGIHNAWESTSGDIVTSGAGHRIFFGGRFGISTKLSVSADSVWTNILTLNNSSGIPYITFRNDGVSTWGNNRLQAGGTNALRLLGGQGLDHIYLMHNNTNPTSGVVNIVTIRELDNSSFAPTSGSANLTGLLIDHRLNQTGTANGIIRGVYYNPTVTSVLGSHYAFESTSGNVRIGGTTSRVDVNDLYVLDLDGVTYKKALGVDALTDRLQIGSGFSTRINLMTNTDVAGNFQVGGTITFTGTSIINANTNQTLVLRTDSNAAAATVHLNTNSDITLDTGTKNIATLHGTRAFAPTTGNGNLNYLLFDGSLNQTGTANGTIRGIYYKPTVTSVLGSHYAWESTSGDVLITGGKVTWAGANTSGSSSITGVHNLGGSAILTGSTANATATVFNFNPSVTTNDGTHQAFGIKIQGSYSGSASTQRKDPVDLYVVGRASIGTSLSLNSIFTAYNTTGLNQPLMIQPNARGAVYVSNNWAAPASGAGINSIIYGDSNLNSSANFIFLQNTSTFNSLTGNNYAIRTSSSPSSAGSVGGIHNISPNITLSNATVALGEGIRLHPYIQTNDLVVTLTNYIGLISGGQIAVAGTGTGVVVTTWTDIKTQDSTGASALSGTTRYGLYVGHTKGNFANSWGVYQSDADTNNYFNGNIVLGGTTVNSSAKKTITMHNGTAPNAAVSNAFQLYADTGKAKIFEDSSRFIVQATSSAKTTTSAPYINDGYVVVTINGTDVKLMTTAG